jgi:predicted anti-sigma-YlaC factor YlaD
MDCSEAKNSFWDYLEKKMEEGKPNVFRAHLSQCETCSKEFAAFSEIIEQVEAQRITSPNPFFVEKVMNKVFVPEPEPVSLEERIFSWLGIFKPAFAAAAIIVSIGFGIYLGLPADLQNRPHPLDAFVETYGLEVDIAENLFD